MKVLKVEFQPQTLEVWRKGRMESHNEKNEHWMFPHTCLDIRKSISESWSFFQPVELTLRFLGETLKPNARETGSYMVGTNMMHR